MGSSPIRGRMSERHAAGNERSPVLLERFPGRIVMAMTMTVNGTEHTLDLEPDMPLLWVLREATSLTGTKYGCGISACGACTVHLNGRAVHSCTLPLSAAGGQQVTTIEGLAPHGPPPRLPPGRGGPP